MSFASPNIRARAAAAIGALLLQALIAWALITGLSVHVGPHFDAALTVFDIAPPVMRKPPPPPVRHRRPAGASAPPHLRARPTAVVAPLPEIRLPPPPPLIVTAPVAALGSESAAGAADRPGPGTGAGGQGSGLGSGNGGAGTGGGQPAEWLRGELSGRDYPRTARAAGVEGSLTTRYVVDARGRVTGCTVTRSSGSPELDETTCRLVMQRFRYAPARDASGRAVSDIVFDDHHWGITRDPTEYLPPD